MSISLDPSLNNPDYAAIPCGDSQDRSDTRWRVLMHVALEAGIKPRKDHDGWWVWRGVPWDGKRYDLLLGYSGLIVAEL
jgi:hypothetical protein